MSRVAEAYREAIGRAFPWAGEAWLDDAFERFCEDTLTPDEATAIGRELALMEREAQGRIAAPLVIIGCGDTRREIGAGEL